MCPLIVYTYWIHIIYTLNSPVFQKTLCFYMPSGPLLLYAFQLPFVSSCPTIPGCLPPFISQLVCSFWGCTSPLLPISFPFLVPYFALRQRRSARFFVLARSHEISPPFSPIHENSGGHFTGVRNGCWNFVVAEIPLLAISGRPFPLTVRSGRTQLRPSLSAFRC